ncbi:MAG: hypothetical protein EON49_13785 [Acidovorax sp.]|nr:MAG: hypothetical protein EON49_13785 [Acidovorax sp.]
MTIQTFTNHDVITLASAVQSVFDMIDHITVDGSLSAAYQYIQDDLYGIFNKIYNRGPALDQTINDKAYNDANDQFDNAHKHMRNAIGLAAGVITSPGVQPEVNKAQGAMKNAQSTIQSLHDDVSQIFESPDTLRYVQALQKATNDPSLNVNDLVKSLLWTVILITNDSSNNKLSFNDALSEIHAQITAVKTADWQGFFELVSLSIDVDNPGDGDDLDKITTILGDVGEGVAVLSLGIVAYNWKANGISPFKSFSNIYQNIRARFNNPVTEDEANALRLRKLPKGR